MKENEISKCLVDSFESLGFFGYKIPDDGMGSAFSIKRPFDIIVNLNGLFLAIETKRSKGWRGLHLRNFQDHQPEILDKVYKSGGFAYVFYVIWIPHQLNRLFPLKFDATLRERLKTGISAKEFKAMEGIDCFKGRYDLSEWIKGLKGS